MTINHRTSYHAFPVNLARGGTATQSSTYTDETAEQAIDGHPDSTCSETIIGRNPWWRLDLRDVYHVNRVVITNRFICCSSEINGAEIHIGNSLENDGNNNPICAVVSSIPAGESYTYYCGEMEGQYLNLLIAGENKILTMCEVEVYGKGRFVAKTMVKMQFISSADLSDPSVRNNLLKQLGTALDNRGLKNVTLQWSQLPKKEVKEVKNAKRCSEGHE
ncbi:fucolectin-like [Triplophysa dalaica]|uniref:fucolectin-like n=1 Tax=Triplophysa dalaica TaxID=1582913 RepID=UPI0024E0074A|nr:fucolectin-like [Triplophysa dalaica]